MFSADAVSSAIKELLSLLDIKISVFDQMRLFESVNLSFNVYMDRSKQNKFAAIVTSSKKGDSGSEGVEEQSTLVLPQEDNKESLVLPYLPFGSGSHLIVNQGSWWGRGESGFIEIGDIKLIPVIKGRCVEIETAWGYQFCRPFSICLRGIGLKYVDFYWKGEVRSIGYEPHETQNIAELVIGRDKWIFEYYQPTQIIKISSFPNFVFSFDKTVVEQVILITHRHEIRKTKYYVFVSKRLD